MLIVVSVDCTHLQAGAIACSCSPVAQQPYCQSALKRAMRRCVPSAFEHAPSTMPVACKETTWPSVSHHRHGQWGICVFEQPGYTRAVVRVLFEADIVRWCIRRLRTSGAKHSQTPGGPNPGATCSSQVWPAGCVFDPSAWLPLCLLLLCWLAHQPTFLVLGRASRA